MVMTLRKRAAATTTGEREEGSFPRKKKVEKPRKIIRRRRRRRRSSSNSDSDSGSSESESDAENGYEKSREQRIRENKARMESLGLLSLSSQFHLHASKPKPKPKLKPKPNPFHRRTSTRKRVPHFESKTDVPEGWQAEVEEVYTQQHETLLGNCQAEWTLNVDGIGDDGELVYDPVNGTCCHHCRQKTLRKHTQCSKCRSTQGHLCGDCLYTRYGENVLEASLNSSWSCPPCRGICNCTRCRRAKGWPPVNIPFSKVTQLGFKSVAHYLILTRCAGATPMESEYVHPSPLHYQGSDSSDSSAEWLHFGDSDDDSDDNSSQTRNKFVAQHPQTLEAPNNNQGFNDDPLI